MTSYVILFEQPHLMSTVFDFVFLKNCQNRLKDSKKLGDFFDIFPGVTVMPKNMSFEKNVPSVLDVSSPGGCPKC